MILSLKTKTYTVFLPLLMTPFSLLVAQIEDDHFILKDFDRAADKAYVETMGIIPRPDMGIIIPVNVQPDGSILLGDPAVDKVPAQSVKNAVCGRTIEFKGLPDRVLVCQ
ncbi:MAG: hypothetical protein L7S53_08255 [Luminiphilus sp.]|nr:hypothetical protein [Luminiphilus sp.]